jgi:hypothetical protein
VTGWLCVSSAVTSATSEDGSHLLAERDHLVCQPSQLLCTRQSGLNTLVCYQLRDHRPVSKRDATDKHYAPQNAHQRRRWAVQGVKASHLSMAIRCGVRRPNFRKATLCFMLRWEQSMRAAAAQREQCV